MSLTDLTVVCGLAIAVGVIGTVVPVLPGALLIGAAVLLWAVSVNTLIGWGALIVVVVLLGAGQVLKYLLVGTRMANSGVPNRSIVAAGLAAVVGFFVLPVVGLVVGFVAGLAAAEYHRRRDWQQARAATVVALRAVGLGILIELAAAVASAATWLGAVTALG